MHLPESMGELSVDYICGDCVHESHLSHEIKQRSKIGLCSYCDTEEPVISIDELADRISAAFEEHYVRTPEYSDGSRHEEWYREGQPVIEAIMEAAEVSEEIAQKVQIILENAFADRDSAEMGQETEFAEESFYKAKKASDRALQEEWSQFEASLKTEARFFSRSAADHLAKVFGHIDLLKTFNGKPVVVNAGPGQEIADLYRARVFVSDPPLEEALCRPDLRLGPPPAKYAAAGRMNARGISVFYGATEAKVAIAEVRPPVGSRVAVARFDIIRPISLLDLSALPSIHQPGSIFDPEYGRRLGRAFFLRSLTRRLVKPVMPGDEEFEYLSTQAIADFLGNENDPLLDGIIFPSVQASSGINVVLFHKAAVVETIELPKGAKLTAYLETLSDEETEPDYLVTERVPTPKHTGEPDKWLNPFQNASVDRAGYKQYEATLRVDLDSVAVHHIDSAQFGGPPPFPVSRRRHQLPAFGADDTADF
ncbi:RES domain-containing protein [Pseudoduganella umbonata]|uniref:RES domain-containing protein n=1 Tax=Pseudoduganella umbonata TaxID=864828 RepID=A0A4P8HTI1_9BURK|nr:RES domain-containing protein [Pseudoduganella umbonata]MBB3224487.1 hypothetical protein [Pseudoduganella umbonata]QCP13257.1 RES domain-containing protein [Pseudoduganella umbonata]